MKDYRFTYKYLVTCRDYGKSFLRKQLNMQPFEEIEKQYETPDPWGYQTCHDDLVRKNHIIEACKLLLPPEETMFNSVVDIGCGEGWITKDLPALTKYGLEVSQNAKSRWPSGIIDVWGTSLFSPELMVATGVMYAHYDSDKFLHYLQKAIIGVVTCNIKAWERQELGDAGIMQKYLGLVQIADKEFPYREYTQKLRVFKKV